MGTQLVNDAHRHIGRMPAYPFYGGPAIIADVTAKGTVDELIANLGNSPASSGRWCSRTTVSPIRTSGPSTSNGLAIEAATTDDRIRCGLWVSPRPLGRGAEQADSRCPVNQEWPP